MKCEKNICNDNDCIEIHKKVHKKKNIEFIENETLISNHSLNYYCDIHKNNKLEYYCDECKQVICSDCIISIFYLIS